MTSSVTITPPVRSDSLALSELPEPHRQTGSFAAVYTRIIADLYPVGTVVLPGDIIDNVAILIGSLDDVIAAIPLIVNGAVPSTSAEKSHRTIRLGNFT